MDAIVGGSVARTAPIAFARPDIGPTEIQAVVEVLESGWLTTGARTHDFEHAFAQALGVQHAIALNSCTAALHLALDAIGLRPGDEVIVPTYTFAATAEVVQYFRARPVLVDVLQRDLNIDPRAVERAITPKTRAIIGVDVAGQPCDWHILRNLAQQFGGVLIDDAAHAFPSFLQQRPIGAWADLTAFSFYATKPLTTGEGGMLVTDNSEWADRARVMALHGISHDAWNRYAAEGSWYYEIHAPGFKYNMTDIAAALGLVQLQRSQEMNDRRAAIAAAYQAAFADVPELETPTLSPDRTTSWHLYVLRLNLDRLSIDRAGFVESLKALGIGTSVHFIPLHVHPFYRQAYSFEPHDFPVAWREYQRSVSLPIYSSMPDADVDTVIDAVRHVAATNRR
jgi:dTDP-4-amino-4,6-dideoxygalactose transaminase